MSEDDWEIINEIRDVTERLRRLVDELQGSAEDGAPEPLTLATFDKMRLAAARRLAPDLAPMMSERVVTLEPLSPPPAGAWVRMTYRRSKLLWHRFDGDLRWSPRFEVRLTAACGYDLGQGTASWDPSLSIDARDEQPDDSCRRCARRPPVSRS